jgi:hypothetical protein
MLIIRFQSMMFSICLYLDLKNAHLFIYISGSLNMLPYIPSYCGLQENLSIYIHLGIKKPLCVYLYQGL